MERAQLSVNLRQGHGKGVARKARARGMIPGIVYGKGLKNIMIEVNPKEIGGVLSSTSGMNAVLEMNIPEQGKITAMLKDYQADNLTRKFTHLDFVTVDLEKKIKVAVPLQIVGKAEGVKEGGVLEVIRRELEVVCLPTSIPKNIELDVSSLKIGQSLHMNDLKLAADIEIPHDQNFTLVSVVAPKEEEVAAPTAEAAAAPTEPEVITAKKPVEGEAEGKEGKDKKSEPKAEKK